MMMMMEKEVKNPRANSKEPDFVLQWGNRKRHRCVKLKNKDHNLSTTNNAGGGGNNNSPSTAKVSSDSLGKKKMTNGVVTTKKDSSHQHSSPHRGLNKSSELSMNKRKASPEKEDRFYTTRGSLGTDENGKLLLDHGVKSEKGAFVWPKLFLSLSSKEKEEDFMAMKGCKLPQRPKKRAKLIQRSVLLVSPGAWLSDLTQERYEVREKKASKKKPRGLKAMGSMESDSE